MKSGNVTRYLWFFCICIRRILLNTVLVPEYIETNMFIRKGSSLSSFRLSSWTGKKTSLLATDGVPHNNDQYAKNGKGVIYFSSGSHFVGPPWILKALTTFVVILDQWKQFTVCPHMYSTLYCTSLQKCKRTRPMGRIPHRILEIICLHELLHCSLIWDPAWKWRSSAGDHAVGNCSTSFPLGLHLTLAWSARTGFLECERPFYVEQHQNGIEKAGTWGLWWHVVDTGLSKILHWPLFDCRAMTPQRLPALFTSGLLVSAPAKERSGLRTATNEFVFPLRVSSGGSALSAFRHLGL